MKRILFCLLAMLAAFVLVTPVHAILINRGDDTAGNRLIYDTDFNITWYDYTNAGNTWQDQVDWAGALSVNFGGDIFDDWRLPTAINQDGSGPDSGFNVYWQFVPVMLPPLKPYPNPQQLHYSESVLRVWRPMA